LETSVKLRRIHALPPNGYYDLIGKINELLSEDIIQGDKISTKFLSDLDGGVFKIIDFLKVKSTGIVCPIYMTYSIQVASLYQSLNLIKLGGDIGPFLGLLTRLVSLLTDLITILDQIDIHLKSNVTFISISTLLPILNKNK